MSSTEQSNSINVYGKEDFFILEDLSLIRKLCVQKFLLSFGTYLEKKIKHVLQNESDEELSSTLKKFFLKNTSIYLANKLGTVIEDDDIQERLEKLFDLYNQVKMKDHLYRIEKGLEDFNNKTLNELRLRKEKNIDLLKSVQNLKKDQDPKICDMVKELHDSLKNIKINYFKNKDTNESFVDFLNQQFDKVEISKIYSNNQSQH